MASHRFIRSNAELSDYLESIRNAKRIDFDTEFISDGKYRTELCLVQAATEFGPILIDPLAVEDMTPFWTKLCDPAVRVTAHSARSEMEFCYKAIGRVPDRLFDIQLAAGFVGIDYPTSLKKLVDEILNIDLPKDETRSDWRVRPLSILQVEYALNDVLYLEGVADKLRAMLERLGRVAWFEEESRDYLARMVASFTGLGWQKVSGITTLGRRELAIVRELWYWREKKAAIKRRSANHILRDDVIIELAKLKTTDPDRLAALRSIHRRSDAAMYVEELPKIIARGLAVPDFALPEIPVNFSFPNYPIASSWLLAILHNEAKKRDLSPNILAVPQDAREMIAYCAGTLPARITPRLMTGWRRDFLGTLPEEILSGKRSVSFDPDSIDAPLRCD
ncbi:MAG: ribonuclease D [Thermoguttaceae bacterium]|nr:ribonuclease D [Thermoguttaceae bacterium]